MIDEYMIKENGYFFTDPSAPSLVETSYGDMIPPGAAPTIAPDAGTSTLDGEKVIRYEDDEVIHDHYTYLGDKLVSYLETNKSTGVMTLFTYTRSQAAPVEPVGSNGDYENFAITGQVGNITDDVPNSSIENYSFTETLIASIGPGDVLIPA